MSIRSISSWQLILADLALILFLLTLATLPGSSREAQQQPATHIAPSQALYRPDASQRSISQWLSEQPLDPRATLTIFARHRVGEESEAWEAARQMAQGARGQGIAVRVVISTGDESDLYASLAYDTSVQD